MEACFHEIEDHKFAIFHSRNMFQTQVPNSPGFPLRTPWIFRYAAAWQNIQHEFSLGSGDASCLSSLEAIGLRVRRGRSGMVSQPSSPLSGQNSSPTRLQKMSVIKPLSQRVNMVTFRRFSHDCVSSFGRSEG
jgi:hypothetical protein